MQGSGVVETLHERLRRAQLMAGKARGDGVEAEARGTVREHGVERGQPAQEHRRFGCGDRRLSGAVRLRRQRIVVLVDDHPRQARKRGETLEQVVVVDGEAVERLREPRGRSAVIALGRDQAEFHQLSPVHLVGADADDHRFHPVHRLQPCELRRHQRAVDELGPEQTHLDRGVGACEVDHRTVVHSPDIGRVAVTAAPACDVLGVGMRHWRIPRTGGGGVPDDHGARRRVRCPWTRRIDRKGSPTHELVERAHLGQLLQPLCRAADGQRIDSARYQPGHGHARDEDLPSHAKQREAECREDDRHQHGDEELTREVRAPAVAEVLPEMLWLFEGEQ